MTVAMTIRVPGAPDSMYEFFRELFGANLNHLDRSIDSSHGPNAVVLRNTDAADEEPTWEDAAWQ
jgi:hypothetical protein